MPFSKYVKLPGSEREPMPGATKTGGVDPNEQMMVTLILTATCRAQATVTGQARGQRPAYIT